MKPWFTKVIASSKLNIQRGKDASDLLFWSIAEVLSSLGKCMELKEDYVENMNSFRNNIPCLNGFLPFAQ